MAANNMSLTTTVDVTTGVALKTILQLAAPANQALRVKGIEIGFQGIVVTDPAILVQIVRQTSAGVGGVVRNPLKKSLGGPAIQSTGLTGPVAVAWGTEPTAGDVQKTTMVHPQGTWSKNFRPDDEIIVDGGGRLAIVVTASVAVDCHASIDAEE